MFKIKALIFPKIVKYIPMKVLEKNENTEIK